MLVFAVVLLVRSRSERAGQPIIRRLVAVILALYIVQAFLGFLIVGMTDSVATEVVHSSFGSLTWLALALLLALTRTLPAAPVGSSKGSVAGLRVNTALTPVTAAGAQVKTQT
jgi:heme A synthase